MKIFPFKALYPKSPISKDPDSYFNSMSRKFHDFYAEDRFLIDVAPKFYIYSIHTKTSQHRGIVVANSIEDFAEGKIHKHETIIPAKTAIIRKAILENQHQIKPLLLGYEQHEEVEKILEEIPLKESNLVSVKFGYGEEHRLYSIDSIKEINALTICFDQISNAFIADGHHRSEATQNIIVDSSEKMERTILCAYFSFDQLSILPFHRSIYLPKEIDQSDFITRLKKYGSLTKIKAIDIPNQKYIVHMYLGGQCYAFKWKSEILEAYAKKLLPIPDTLLINKIILNKVLKYTKSQAAKSMTYISGNTKIEDLAALSKRSNEMAFFIVHPVNSTDLSNYILAGEIYPPKTTWFEPKIRSGIVAKAF